MIGENPYASNDEDEPKDKRKAPAPKKEAPPKAEEKPKIVGSKKGVLKGGIGVTDKKAE